MEINANSESDTQVHELTRLIKFGKGSLWAQKEMLTFVDFSEGTATELLYDSVAFV